MRGLMIRNVVGMGIAAAILVISGCNTVSGAGKDLSSAGTAVSNTADDVAH